MNLDDWPDCIVPGCANKCCLALDSDKCFPHTKGNQHVKRWKIAASHADDLAVTEPTSPQTEHV